MHRAAALALLAVFSGALPCLAAVDDAAADVPNRASAPTAPLPPALISLSGMTIAPATAVPAPAKGATASPALNAPIPVMAPAAVPSAAPAAAAVRPASPAAHADERAGAETGLPAAIASLEKAGYATPEATDLASRMDGRVRRIAALLRAETDAWLPQEIKNAEVLSMLMGARPAIQTRRQTDQGQALLAAARLVDPRARAVKIESKDGYGYVFIYNPEQVLAAMRRATRSNVKGVSFAAELKALAKSGQSEDEWLQQWLDGWLGQLSRNSEDARVGILLGYPERDVADLINKKSGSGDGPLGINVPFGSRENAIHWLTSNSQHPETRKMAALYETSFAMAERKIGLPQPLAPLRSPSRNTMRGLWTANLNQAAYTFARAALRPDSTPNEKLALAREWRLQAEALESATASDGAPLRAWDRLHVARDGTVRAFYRSGDRLVSYVLSGAPGPSSSEPIGLEPGQAPSEAAVLALLGGDGTFLAVPTDTHSGPAAQAGLAAVASQGWFDRVKKRLFGD
jgi:hypothetical protein